MDFVADVGNRQVVITVEEPAKANGENLKQIAEAIQANNKK